MTIVDHDENKKMQTESMTPPSSLQFLYTGVPLTGDGPRVILLDEENQEAGAPHDPRQNSAYYSTVDKVAKVVMVVTGILYLLGWAFIVAAEELDAPHMPSIRQNGYITDDEVSAAEFDVHRPSIRQKLYIANDDTVSMDDDLGATELSAAPGFDEFISTNEHVFVLFHAPWCVWSQRLSPTWDRFANRIEKENLNVKVVKVDCVAEAGLCSKQRITAFPTLRWYKHGKANQSDYEMARTVEAFV